MTQNKLSFEDVPVVKSLRSVSDTDSGPFEEYARMLAATDGTDHLASTPTVVLCPNCGDIVATYEQGLPKVVPQFAARCTTCKTDLRRWCAVTVNAAFKHLIEPPTLTAMTQSYWDEQLWAGVTNHKNQPRNDEYTEWFSSKASDFGWGWELRCPLCRRGITQLKRDVPGVTDGLDYHHWSANPDRGITLCRECHDVIGFGNYDSEVEERAHELGFRSRNDLQVIRLALREAIVTDRPVAIDMAEQLVRRYNLIQQVDEVQGLLKTILRDDDLRKSLMDATLYDGFKPE